MKTVTLNFTDGVVHTLEVAEGESILDAALEKELPVLYQCRSGSCSSCIATLMEGESSVLDGASSTLLPSDMATGQRLLCVCQADSDCSFDLAYSSEVSATAPQQFSAFVDSAERIGSNVVKLTVELAEGDWVEFRPGQFMQIEVPGLGVVRSYSPSSTNIRLPKMEFLIRLLPDGAMSGYLENQVESDDVLTMSGPYGAFFLREEYRHAPHIFVAGGTGLAPIMSMVDTIHRFSGRKPPMLLSFGCAVPEALFSLDDLSARENWLPTLEVRVCVDRNATEGLYEGSPVSVLQQSDVTDPDTVAYLCGPQPMIDAATKRLIELGVNPERIFAEQFVASQ